MANGVATIGYVASDPMAKGDWQDERGNSVEPQPGMTIDRDLLDAGWAADLLEKGLDFACVRGFPGIFKVIKKVQ